MLAGAGAALGGRLSGARRLEGLSAWGGVVDYRGYQLSEMCNVDSYVNSKLPTDGILEFGLQHGSLAPGSSWRADGVARYHVVPMPNDGSVPIYTPDDLMRG